MTAHLIFGCGYLGLRVADRWLATGKSVVAVTRSKQRAAEFATGGIVPSIGDICDPQAFPQLPETVDTVLFAVGFDRTAGRSQEDVFVGGLRNVVTAIGARCRRLIYISSTSVYGQSDGSWVDESSPCEPVQPGGIACLAAERVLHDEFSKFDPDWTSAVVLRVGGIYGPQRLLTRIGELKTGTPLTGSPDAWLNLIHADDAATTVLAAGTHESPPETVIVTDDQPVQRRDYYSRLAELTGASPPTFDSKVERGRGSGGLNKRCSNRRLREILKVELKYPTFEEGLWEAVQGA